MESLALNRYSRQVLFQSIGKEGQERLRNAKIAMVGLGALGTVAATQLTRAGVGYLRLIDRDIIEASNLQRQSLYDESDAAQGRPKAEAAAEKLRLSNSDVTIESVIADLTWRNADRLLGDVDVVVDGSDNFEVRYLINEIAVKHQIPWSYGGAVSSYGTTAFFRPGATPCLVCMFGEYQGGGHDTCDTVGVISPIVNVVASLQVTEVLKYLTGNLDCLSNSVVTLDVWRNDFQRIQFSQPREGCPCCNHGRYPMLTPRTDAGTVSLCGRRTVQVQSADAGGFSLEAAAERLAKVGKVRATPNLVRCELEDFQITLFADGRALFHGVEDPAVARSLYARYVGG